MLLVEVNFKALKPENQAILDKALKEFVKALTVQSSLFGFSAMGFYNGEFVGEEESGWYSAD